MLNLDKTPSQTFHKRLVNIKYSQLIIEDLKKLESINKHSLKEAYLLKSYIMNLVASWQIFIEELLRFGVKEILKSELNEQLKTIVEGNLKDKIKRFNTPNTENIDLYFNSILGISKITDELSNAQLTKQIINEILENRHLIAHKGHSKINLTLEGNFLYMNTLFEAAKELELLVIQKINHIGRNVG